MQGVVVFLNEGICFRSHACAVESVAVGRVSMMCSIGCFMRKSASTAVDVATTSNKPPRRLDMCEPTQLKSPSPFVQQWLGRETDTWSSSFKKIELLLDAPSVVIP